MVRGGVGCGRGPGARRAGAGPAHAHSLPRRRGGAQEEGEEVEEAAVVEEEEEEEVFCGQLGGWLAALYRLCPANRSRPG